jgi:hypothetical protein
VAGLEEGYTHCADADGFVQWTPFRLRMMIRFSG